MPDGRYLPLRVRSLVGLDAAACGGNDRAGVARCDAGISRSGSNGISTIGPISPASISRWQEPGARRSPAHRPYPRPSDEMSAPPHARSGRISERLRRSFAEQVSPGTSLSFLTCTAKQKRRELRASGIADRDLRRQLELARAGLVPDQLSAHRVAPKISSLLRRRFQSRMPDRFRHIPDVERDRERTIKSPNPTLAAR